MFCDVIFDHDQNWVLFLIFLSSWFTFHVSENNHQFSSFTHSVKADHKEWSWWNSFIKIDASFFIIMYNSHVLHSYSSHLIRSSNHANFMFHFMLSIKLIKYKSSSFLIIMNYDSSTYLLIRSSFKNHNKLIWNIKWIFISDDNSSSYA